MWSEVSKSISKTVSGNNFALYVLRIYRFSFLVSQLYYVGFLGCLAGNIAFYMEKRELFKINMIYIFC